MKRLMLFLLSSLFVFAMFAQGNSGTAGLFQKDPNAAEYKPGEILVKFKDDVQINKQLVKGKMTTGVAAIDQLNEKYQVATMTKVFRGSVKNATNRSISLPNGEKRQLAQVFNIYKLVFPITQDAKQAVEDYKSLPEVEYAELNGSAGIVGGIPTSEPFSLPASRILHPVSIIQDPASRILHPASLTPNDPLYSQQWAIPYIKADSLWSFTTGDTTQVIGILDTGVDWQHPDLVNKIWINTDEIPNNGIDDDNNGFIDDVRGWDFVNDDNNPRDDNSHGTHCAGIAAAEANNGIGIAGVSWGAKIMPVKVFQSNGIGYFSQIAEGIWYAAQNGCTIYSNSWSSGGESMTIRTALEYAYSKGLIVAAAGNTNCKTDLPCPPWPPYQPNYPACYNWVLGVEATDQNGNNAWFSNFDPTGPVISDGRPYGSLYWNDYDYNYEMRAPGVSFISTVPNGQYRSYSGTSMACPLVAGSIALMKSYDPTLSNEQVFAKLIQPIKINMMQAGVLDILKCTMTNPPPDLYFIRYSINDSLFGDHDGRPDAGETFDMYIRVKNSGGNADSVFAKLRFSEFEDTTVATILKKSCSLGSISAYGTNTSFDAVRIHIDSNVVHFRNISFELLIWSKSNPGDTIYKGINITVEHGIEIHGNYGKLTLSPNAYYIVTGPSVMDSLIVKPGTILTFNPGMFIAVIKYLHAAGTPDSLITFKGVSEGLYWGGIICSENTNASFRYCKFLYGGGSSAILVRPKNVQHCIFDYCINSIVGIWTPTVFKYNLVTNHINNSDGSIFVDLGAIVSANVSYNVFAENNSSSGYRKCFFGSFMRGPSDTLEALRNNVFIDNIPYHIWLGGDYLAYKYIPKNYWGATNLDVINSQILDFFENPSLYVVQLNGILNQPPDSCHGVVWKVEINDQNPQNVPMVIGNGPAKFSVFFNRPMDTSFNPFLTFGVRFPFTQNAVLDSSYWSADHKVWTAYKTIDMSTGDGQNTIRVAYAKDLDHFEIPIERSRFNFVIQAASSQSVDFIATPGIGKVHLEWPLSDSTNVLGYNLYRFTMPTPSTFSDTLLINNSLLTDSLYNDFAVTPGMTYYYLFTVVRTDFSESDYSKVVFATPLTAANGDANGDGLVNVLDVTTVISFMLNQNPQPFMFDAADVNNDNAIDILDVIGIVNLINGKKKAGTIVTGINPDPAYIWLDSTSITFQSTGQVAALQFELSGKNLSELELICRQQGFEFAHGIVNCKLLGILYNTRNQAIREGMVDLFSILQPGSTMSWGEVRAGDADGNRVIVQKGVKGLAAASETNLQASPNPFSSSLTLSYSLDEPASVNLAVYDLSGKLVSTIENKQKPAGISKTIWNGRSGDNMALPSGIYMVRLSGETSSGNKIKSEVKIILNK